MDRKTRCLASQITANKEFSIKSKIQNIEASKPYYQEIEELKQYFKNYDQKKLNNLNLQPRKHITHKLKLTKI